MSTVLVFERQQEPDIEDLADRLEKLGNYHGSGVSFLSGVDARLCRECAEILRSKARKP